MPVVKIVNWDYRIPLTVHLLVTSRCNLSCPRCFYRGSGELSLEKILELFDEWSRLGVKSVAIGGGEPLLHPDIETITKEAKRRGFYVAITTNGTVRKRVSADRVHISFDELHATSLDTVQGAMDFFKGFVPSVGINHIVTSIEALKLVSKLDVSTITLLMEKPTPRFSEWEKAFSLIPEDKLWVDACLGQKLGLGRCRQGITSMCVDQNLKASKCSNIKERTDYTNLPETWERVRGQKCHYQQFQGGTTS